MGYQDCPLHGIVRPDCRPQEVGARQLRRQPARLAGAAHAVLPFGGLVADAGYDSEANHGFCREELGAHSLTPAKKRHSVRVIATTPYRQEMARLLGEPGDEASREAYHQRWKVETVVSVVKRR